MLYEVEREVTAGLAVDAAVEHYLYVYDEVRNDQAYENVWDQVLSMTRAGMISVLETLFDFGTEAAADRFDRRLATVATMRVIRG